MGVSVSDGAMALTRIFCAANSAAKLLVRPSIAAFEVAIDAWNGIPVLAATELKSTMLALSAFLRFDNNF